MKISSLIYGAALMAMVGPAIAGGDGWTADFAAAKEQAAKEGKDLLMDFTGSDWCGWCIKLDKEVFQHDAFKAGVKDHFVLVEIDSPRDKSLISEETAKQNEELGERYAVQGYPTILLCDAGGRPYSSTGYRQGGPEKYVAHLDELREVKTTRDEAFAAAAKAEGVDKARALLNGLDAMMLEPPVVAAFYGDVVEQIKQSDPDDETGFVGKLKLAERMQKFEEDLSTLAMNKDMDGALKLIDENLKQGGFDTETIQKVMITKAMVLLELEKFDEALAQIDAAIAFAPESPDNEQIRGFKQRVTAHIEGLKAEAKEEPKAAE